MGLRQCRFGVNDIDLGVELVYNTSIMKRLVLLYLVLSLQGCAVYTGASLASYATTGKSIGDHTATKLTNADCDVWRASIELTYYCEYLREPGTTYNRTAF